MVWWEERERASSSCCSAFRALSQSEILSSDHALDSLRSRLQPQGRARLSSFPSPSSTPPDNVTTTSTSSLDRIINTSHTTTPSPPRFLLPSAHHTTQPQRNSNSSSRNLSLLLFVPYNNLGRVNSSIRSRVGQNHLDWDQQPDCPSLTTVPLQRPADSTIPRRLRTNNGPLDRVPRRTVGRLRRFG